MWGYDVEHATHSLPFESHLIWIGHAISGKSSSEAKQLTSNLGSILNDFSSEIKKTKEMSSIINKLEISNSLLILDKNSKEKIEKSARNIPNVKITDVNHFSAYDIIKFKKVVFTESSVKELEKRYS